MQNARGLTATKLLRPSHTHTLLCLYVCIAPVLSLSHIIYICIIDWGSLCADGRCVRENENRTHLCIDYSILYFQNVYAARIIYFSGARVGGIIYTRARLQIIS